MELLKCQINVHQKIVQAGMEISRPTYIIPDIRYFNEIKQLSTNISLWRG